MQYIQPVGAQGAAIPGVGNEYVDKNAGAGLAGSFVAADAIEHPLRELVHLISSAGLTPSGSDLAQVTKAVRSQRLNYVAAVTGTANAITVTLDPAPSALADLVGMPIRLRTGASANTGPVTISVNGLPAQSARGPDNLELLEGDFPATTIVDVVWNGAFFQVMSRAVPAAQRTPAAFVMTTSAAQSIAASTQTAVGNFASTTNNVIDSTLAADRITIGARDAGWWVIGGKIMYDFPVSGVMYTNLLIERNGVEIGAGNAAGTTSIRARPQALTVWKFAAGDIIRLTTSTDTARSLISGSSIFSGFKVGA